jgi:hypothetical protein
LHNLEELDKKQNLSQREKSELETKKNDYEQKLKVAKDETIKNIKNQLKKNDLNITELHDNRN